MRGGVRPGEICNGYLKLYLPLRERSSGAVDAQLGLVSPRVVDGIRNHAREKDPIMRHRIVDTTDKQSFISENTRKIVMRIQGLSHMFSISLLV